jgi:hypothetical protein
LQTCRFFKTSFLQLLQEHLQSSSQEVRQVFFLRSTSREKREQEFLPLSINQKLV